MKLKEIAVCVSVFLLASFSPAKRYVKKAGRAIEKGNIASAKENYRKALVKNPEHHNANIGMGLLYCELLDNYTAALPHLEKAYTTRKDSAYDLLFALAKCYHHNGEYEKAISYYNRLNGVVDLEREIDFQKEIQKRKKDCQYAIGHKNDPLPPNIYIVNAGRAINTEMPEYVPVLTPKKELIFTSKRKDTKKEPVNYLDGKYFESMYITDIGQHGFKNVRRYTLPDDFLRSHYTKNHESVISVSQDGKTLFTFHNSKIYEINLEDRATQKPEKLLESLNFNFYQNHAFLARDGRTLYFTSDADGGLGGNDIYKCTKNDKGEWSMPENLGEPINTPFDDDAPYLSHDGTVFYFASKGHEGFGNYDIYKSAFVDGKWARPENLGQPVNSPGHDIFLVTDSASANGYFSSGRNGGFGDMDVYKIVYLDKMNTDCPAGYKAPVEVFVNNDFRTGFKNRVEVKVPANYRVMSYSWKIGDQPMAEAGPVLEHDYEKPGTYLVGSKVTAWCDTCLDPVIACHTIENKFDPAVIPEVTVTPAPFDPSSVKGELSPDQLAALGFNNSHLLFDFNDSKLRQDAISILETNVEVLKKHPSLRLLITGYSDARGSEKRNRVLSAQRARTVKEYLFRNGVRQSQVKFSAGKGSENLVNNCRGPECDETAHQQNRRVEFTVTVE